MVFCNNIFLIEDDEDDQMLFINAIKKMNSNIKYAVAHDGYDALNKLRILKHLPDIIFLDINMSRMNGFEFLTHVKAEKPFNKIPVVVLSTSNNIAEKAYQHGASGFVIKPPSFNRLRSEIENVLTLTKKVII